MTKLDLRKIFEDTNYVYIIIPNPNLIKDSLIYRDALKLGYKKIKQPKWTPMIFMKRHISIKMPELIVEGMTATIYNKIED